MHTSLKNLFSKKQKKDLFTVAALSFPAIGVPILLKNSFDKNPEKFKTTITNVHDVIKKDFGSVVNKSSSLVNGAFNKLMFPLIAISSIVIIVVLFKK